MPSAQVIDLNARPHGKPSPLETTLSAFTNRYRQNRAEDAESDALRQIYQKHQQDGSNIQDTIMKLQTEAGISPTARVTGINQLLSFQKHNADLQKQSKENYEKAEKQASNQSKLRDLESRRGLEEGSLAAYEDDPKMAEQISRESRSRLSEQPINEDQLRRLDHVRSLPEFTSGSPSKKYELLTRNGVSSVLAEREASIYVEQEKAKGGKVYQKDREQKVADYVSNSLAARDQAEEAAVAISDIKEAIEGDIAGPGLKAILKNNEYGQLLLGQTPDEAKLTTANKKLLEGAKGLFGSRPTEREIFLLLGSMLPAVGKSKEANQTSLYFIEKLNELKIIRGDIVEELSKDGYVADLESQVYQRMKPLFAEYKQELEVGVKALEDAGELTAGGKKPPEAPEKKVDQAKKKKPDLAQSNSEVLGFSEGQVNQPDQPVNPSEEPESEASDKIGKAKSILAGFAEAALFIPGLIQAGSNKIKEGIDSAVESVTGFSLYGKGYEKGEQNHILDFISSLPESEDESSRRLRAGASGITAGAIGGIPGILAGLVGSQAGQTVREVYGEEGKLEGWAEAGAIGADLLAGLGTGIVSSAARSGARQANKIPAVFRAGDSVLERASIKNAMTGEKRALDSIIDGFTAKQIKKFEQEASQLSPKRFTELSDTPLSNIKKQADDMFRNSTLDMISPLQVTSEQGGRAIQEAANETFQSTVVQAERKAYTKAREAATGVEGQAPETLNQAIKLRDDLIATSPSTEQNPIVSYLNRLIGDLETPAQKGSKLVDASGRPLTSASGPKAASLPANEMVDLVQKGNHAVNYGSEFREQSHRLSPIINTLRQETQTALRAKPEAANLYQQANTLHARNAETWGTRFMRNVRFSENPESLPVKLEKASNMRNLKQAVPNEQIHNIADRLAVDKITKAGTTSSNARALHELNSDLSPRAREAARMLVDVKDPLTSSGGRAAIRNEILKDAAKAINTGKRPEKILDLMGTPKGYGLVRETLNQSNEGKNVLQSFNRLFVDDLVQSISDSSGRIDFKKSRNIFKNIEMRQATEQIAGPGVARRFDQLEQAALNFERNSNMYSSEPSQSIIKSAVKNIRDSSIIGTVLHSLHVPWSVIAAAGLGGATIGTTKSASKSVMRRVLANPKAVNLLDKLSRSTTPEQVANQLPRLIEEVRKHNND